MADIPKLIRIYRANECLWNANSLGYYNVALKDVAWRRIAFVFGNIFSIAQLKEQIRQLKRYYVDECMAIERNQNQGFSYVPRYSFFKDLCFLAASKSFHLAQMRAKLENDQINCIIENADASPLNSSRERMPSVHVDFRTAAPPPTPAYGLYETSLNQEENIDSLYSMETNFNDGEQRNYTFSELEARNNSPYIRAESGTDRWYPTEHCVSCSRKNADEEDVWRNSRDRGTRTRANRSRAHIQSESTITNQCECKCECNAEEDESERELSRSGSRSWKQYGGSNHNDLGTRNSGYNSPTEDTWSHHRSNANLRSTSLYSNWPGPKLCGQSRPKKYLVRCKPCAKSRTSEKNCGRHWKRNNDALCQRLNAQLSMQRQNNEDSYQCAYRRPFQGGISRQCSWERSRRRSSGAERHSSRQESNPYNDNYQQQQQQQQQQPQQQPPQAPPLEKNYESGKYSYCFRKKKRKHHFQEQPTIACIQPSQQEHCLCSGNYNEAQMMPCPVHHRNIDYQATQYPQIPPPPTNPLEYPPPIQYDNVPENAKGPQQASQPLDEPRAGQSPRAFSMIDQQPPAGQSSRSPRAYSINDQQPPRTSDQPTQQAELMENPNVNPPTTSPRRDPGEYENQSEYVVNPAFKRQEDEVRLSIERGENGNHPEYEVRRSIERAENKNQPDYATNPSFERQPHEDLTKYVICPAFEHGYRDRDRDREYRRSRRRHYGDNDMDYDEYNQRRYPNDYMDERERYARYRERPEESRRSSRRRDREDIDYIDCPAYRQRSPRRHYDDEDPQPSRRPRRRHSSEREYDDDRPQRERRNRDEESCYEDCPGFRRHREDQMTEQQGKAKGKTKMDEGKNCEKKECPFVKQTRPQRSNKKAVEEPRTRSRSQSKTAKGRSSAKTGNRRAASETETETERNYKMACECNSDSDHDQMPKRNGRSSNVKRELPSDPPTEVDTEAEEDNRKHRRPYKCPEMCEVAVETDIDMTLKGRKCPQNRFMDCYCSSDKLENSANLLSCDCDTDTKSAESRKVPPKTNANNSKRGPQKTNKNGSPNRSAPAANPIVSTGNKKRQRSGYEPSPKLIDGPQPTMPPIAKPVILKSFLIPPTIAKATMGIINNHISNFNQLLLDQQCLANKPVVRCLRRKPIPKPSRKNQLSEHQTVVLSGNPFQTIDFNASKRDVIILHPPVKDFRPSKNSFGIDDVEVKHVQVQNTEQKASTQSRAPPPSPPPVKPKRVIH